MIMTWDRTQSNGTEKIRAPGKYGKEKQVSWGINSVDLISEEEIPDGR